MKNKIFTKIVCMMLCICILLPTFASCSGFWGNNDSSDTDPDDGKPDDGKPDDGKPDDGKPDDGKPDDGKPDDEKPGGDTPGGDTPGGDTPGGDTPGGDTPGGDTPGGDTETTYYKVSFGVAIEEYVSRITLPEEKLYKAGTEIQSLPTPGVREMLFMGWYYDAAMTQKVELTDKVNSHLKLYAKVVDTSEDISVTEGVYYHTVFDAPTDYVFSVKADSLEDATTYLSLVNVSSSGAILSLGSDYTVEERSEGIFDVKVNYKAGKSYRATIIPGYYKDIIVDDEPSSEYVSTNMYYIVDGDKLSEYVTTLNVLTDKEDVSNLALSDNLIYIKRSEIKSITDTANGLVSVTESGSRVNSGDVGYFVYDGAVLKSGDHIAIYEGDIPSERDFGTENGSVKYLTVTGRDNNVYKFKISDSKDVLFIPDIIPVAGKTNAEKEVMIPIEELDFSSDMFKELGMNEDTTVEAGDYIAFFDGPMIDETPVEYVRITKVTRDDDYYYVDYVVVSYDDVMEAMDLYHTRTQSPELSDERVEELARILGGINVTESQREAARDMLLHHELA